MPALNSPSRAVAGFNVAAQAERAAHSAARRAGVTVGEVEDMASMRTVSALLESVWGRGAEGVPLNSEVLRAVAHSGGCVTVAREDDGTLVGAAALMLAEPAGSTYSLIAAAAPGASDRGIGYAVKLRQRAWALAHEHDTMVWTFDPLVGRNARFNLAKLGTEAPEYDIAFYGRMSDEINGEDDSDRLVARWRLASRRTVAATEGTAADPAGPVEGTEGAEVLREGPDGAPMAVRDARGLWCRVPRDIVALRRDRPQEATRWRLAVRETLTGALDEGLVATHMSRDGWYLLTPEEVVS